MAYKVSAIMHGKRIITNISFNSFQEAEEYSRDTKKNFPGSRPEIIEVPGVWYALKRDGKEIKRFDSKNAALAYLHKVTPCSWDHAMKYEGYTIDEVPS